VSSVIRGSQEAYPEVRNGNEFHYERITSRPTESLLSFFRLFISGRRFSAKIQESYDFFALDMELGPVSTILLHIIYSSSNRYGTVFFFEFGLHDSRLLASFFYQKNII